jgi:hypothetical protein
MAMNIIDAPRAASIAGRRSIRLQRPFVALTFILLKATRPMNPAANVSVAGVEAFVDRRLIDLFRREQHGEDLGLPNREQLVWSPFGKQRNVPGSAFNSLAPRVSRRTADVSRFA